jgi:uncharacterized membrane protein YdfJ with MMPL/SSD domain
MREARCSRVLLVTATMRLLGQANWWAPPPKADPPYLSTERA